MTMRPARRSAFTLMELIVVIGIIVILAALAVKFLPNLDRHKGVPNAVTQLHGWVHLSRLQAVRDGTGHGVRLIEDSPLSGRVTALQYIEQPDPYAPRGPGIKIDIRPMLCYDQFLFPATATPPYTGFLTVVTLYQDLNNVYTQALQQAGPPTEPAVPLLDWDGVQPGDYFQLLGSPSANAGIRRFSYPPLPSPPGFPPAPTGQHKLAQIVLDRLIEGADIPGSYMEKSDGFRVIRQPRPLVGEPMLQMDKDVYIDLSRSHPCPPWVAPQFPAKYQARTAWTPYIDPNTGQSYLDILFNSSGAVANAPYGQVFLWVQHIDRINDNTLLGVYTRTGKVAPYSIVDLDPNNFDPYGYARAGTTPGL